MIGRREIVAISKLYMELYRQVLVSEASFNSFAVTDRQWQIDIVEMEDLSRAPKLLRGQKDGHLFEMIYRTQKMSSTK